MSDENLEEWDESFLDKIIEAEERHLSSSSSVNQFDSPCSSYLPPPRPPPPSHHQTLHFPPPPSRTDSLSFSPPRALSQRTADSGGAFTSNPVFAKCDTPSIVVPCVYGSDNAKDIEIERLKKELARHVSKQKEINKEGDQIGLHKAKSSCEAIGVQTDLNGCSDLSKKLQAVWGLPSKQQLGKSMISKLFAVCSTDINVLLGFISMSPSSKTMDPQSVKSSDDTPLKHSMHPFLSAEAAKVSRFYSTLTKFLHPETVWPSVPGHNNLLRRLILKFQSEEISSGMFQLEALFESLFDLCSVENEVIVYRSLHMLHVLLKHVLTFERKSEGRENILVEHLHSRGSIDDILGYETRRQVCVGMDGTYASCMPTEGRPFEAETLWKKGNCDTGPSSLFSSINWINLFELMRLIVVKSSEECVRLEAVSIMNVILMRSDAYTEREKFGLIQVFGSISQLLKMEVGLLVQKEAVHMLFLLLNCPKLLVTFCSGCTMAARADVANDGENTAAFQGFTLILEGLADCIAFCGNSVQALELRKNAITLLAFVASSGKPGFEILANYKLSREANLLTLVLQQLASEIDIEASSCPESSKTFRARTLLIREVLILLNRLVSNPVHSATVLRLLTHSRDMASLTIDVANRLSRKEQKIRQCDSKTKQIRESEIVDLGQKFKRRVCTYLGE